MKIGYRDFLIRPLDLLQQLTLLFISDEVDYMHKKYNSPRQL